MHLMARRGIPFVSTTYLGAGTILIILMFFIFTLVNNLWYFFAIILFGLCLMLQSLIMSHRMVSHLVITSLVADPEHSGTETTLNVGVQNNTNNDFIIHFPYKDIYLSYMLKAKQITLVEIPYMLPHRGYSDFPNLPWVIFSPLAMTRAWGTFSVKAEHKEAHKLLAYPEIYHGSHLLNPLDVGRGNLPDYDEMNGMREYRKGDNKRDISWKASSHTNRLLVVERPKMNNFDVQWIRWSDIPEDMSFEDKCSVMAKWIRDYERQNLAFGLELIKDKVAIGAGTKHIHHCLEILALMDESGGHQSKIVVS